MKSKTLRLMGGLVALIASTSFGQTTQLPSVSTQPTTQPAVIGTPSVASLPFSQKTGLGKMLKQKMQEAEAQATVVIPTASQTLASAGSF